ncbi:ATP-binding protein [Sorangium sp. So ce185]|uniref:HD domain-containing protein n=1 Tax=Sorangium sp. So ce185 TaxID=3133287 RepID=UPI003F5D84D5
MTISTLLNDTICTEAEKNAEAVEKLPAFQGFKLSNVKSRVAMLLGHIGREQIFEQFTRHDITHINKMLGMLDWLIPERTQKAMTPCDWLMLTLSIYFHDSGMLVTRDEFARRANSGFPAYVSDVLLVGDAGKDLETKLASLSQEQRERFYYQEYVRHHHAKRIRAWSTGRNVSDLGDARLVVEEINKMLGALPETFRKDLGLVCESHHLNDLEDLSKYQVSQPYGDLPEESCNLQYIAVMLRTADLLHMTQDRTPSVEFRLIAPTDPISQQEWAKQMAVRTVRSRLGRDRDGVVDKDLPRDTIEVYAHFKEPSGFFGLTSFLSYAKRELQQSHAWVTYARKEGAANYEFPWRDIDDSHVEAEGFLRQQFEFTLDQGKILDLLTGHTIYNDATVVLRELTQNAIDAVRVQRIDAQEAGDRSYKGAIAVTWSSERRVLEVQDNGTGMSQAVIERHLLRAGSSKYQEADFRKRYPKFSPISRFGIGVLSCFMLADSVEIITAAPGDPQARLLSLRSVHGRYLIRTLDKKVDPEAKRVGAHGTVVRLHVRPSADVGDVAEIMRRWIVVPECEVTLSVDGLPAHRVGFDSVKAALSDELRRFGHVEGPELRVDEVSENGVTIACAVEWSDTFKEWSLVEIPRGGSDSPDTLVGTCVEGVRVEFTTPGYGQSAFYALCNVSGPGAPKTNVARSAFEVTGELYAALRVVYRAYCKQVADEASQLERRGFSKTWAAEEARWLLAPLWTGARPINSTLLDEAIAQVPLVVRESKGQRARVSIADIRSEEYWWTTDSALFTSAESLIREVPGDVSLAGIMSGIGSQVDVLPAGTLVCNMHGLTWSYPGELLRSRSEVDKIVVDTTRRRIDLRWRPSRGPALWMDVPEEANQVIRQIAERHRARRSYDYLVGSQSIEMVGLEGIVAVRAFGLLLIVPGSKLAEYLLGWLRRARAGLTRRAMRALAVAFECCDDALSSGRVVLDADEMRWMAQREGVSDEIDTDELRDAIGDSGSRVFDVSAWRRREVALHYEDFR